jgi:hypothetical protein
MAITPAELASNVIAMAKKRLAVSNSRSQTELTREVFRLHRLETLLHTMRCIAQYEDVLCELSHEIRTAGRVSNQANAELRSSIVSNLPSKDYMYDLNSVRAIFVEVKHRSLRAHRVTRSRANFANTMTLLPKQKPQRRPRGSKLEREVSSWRDRQDLVCNPSQTLRAVC